MFGGGVPGSASMRRSFRRAAGRESATSHTPRTTAMTDVRILSEPLGGAPLSQLLQRGEAPADWFTAAPTRRRRVACARPRACRLQGLECSVGRARVPRSQASGEAAARLERVRRGGGVVVTTGQQPGLFGGPVYTWSKAMGALAFADAIERATGFRPRRCSGRPRTTRISPRRRPRSSRGSGARTRCATSTRRHRVRRWRSRRSAK